MRKQLNSLTVMKRFGIIAFMMCAFIAGRAAEYTYISYETGTHFTSSETIAPTWEITEQGDDYFISTFQCSCAINQESYYYPGTLTWRIPGFGLNDIAGEPEIPGYYPQYTLPDGYDWCEIEIIETQYSDFSCTLSPAIPVVADTEPQYTAEITPYSGFFPTGITEYYSPGHYRGNRVMNIGLRPVQYDYENKTVRAYSKITYKVKYLTEMPAGIHSAVVNSDNSDATYYNLQGQPVAQPQSGTLYIVKRGDKVTKEIL